MIYLASRSPRRLELLAQLGIECRLLLDDDESRAESLEAILAGETPARYVQRVALSKAQAAMQRLSDSGLPAAVLLCADTTVAVGSTILGKPQDAEDATRMLRLLSGRSHKVFSAVVVAEASRSRLLCAMQVSRVRFSRLKAAQIAAYIATGEPFGKAGGYAIQGRAAGFIRNIDGSHSGIMGLPLFETAQLLRKAGYPTIP